MLCMGDVGISLWVCADCTQNSQAPLASLTLCCHLFSDVCQALHPCAVLLLLTPGHVCTQGYSASAFPTACVLQA